MIENKIVKRVRSHVDEYAAYKLFPHTHNLQHEKAF